MRPLPCLLLCSALSACGTTTDDGSTPAPLVCDAIVDGLWTASGPPFGMTMDTTITFDAAACEFTASDWNLGGQPMSHSSMMWGGVVDHDAVSLYGSTEFWDSCEGTLDEGGMHLAGTCADADEGRDAFDLVLVE